MKRRALSPSDSDHPERTDDDEQALRQAIEQHGGEASIESLGENDTSEEVSDDGAGVGPNTPSTKHRATTRRAAYPPPKRQPRPLDLSHLPAPKRAFRLHARNILLTWPQCDTPIDTIRDNIKGLWGDRVTYSVTSHEDHHETDGVHRHSLVCFKRKTDIKKIEDLNSLAGKHGDYRAADRTLATVIQYVKKDGNFVEDGAPPQTEGLKTTKVIADLICGGATLLDLHEIPQRHFLLLHKKPIQDFIAYHQEWKTAQAAPVKLPWTDIPLDNPGLPDDAWRMIALWLNKNTKLPREHRQKQLYVWGDTGLGKTLLAKWLEQFFHIYYMPHSKWLEHYDDVNHNMVVCDEFNGGCNTIAFINEFTQGTPMALEIKGSTLFKTNNPPIIFLSNRRLTDWYKVDTDPSVIAALKARFVQVQVTQQAPLFKPPTVPDDTDLHDVEFPTFSNP